MKKSEAELTTEIEKKMLSINIKEMEAKFGKALLVSKTRRSVEPQKFLDKVEGDLEKLFAVSSIRLEGDRKKGVKGADDFLSQEDINSISTNKTKLILLIQSLVPNATQPTIRFV